MSKDPASKVYVNIKHKTCQNVGIESIIIELDEEIYLNISNNLKAELMKL